MQSQSKELVQKLLNRSISTSTRTRTRTPASSSSSASFLFSHAASRSLSTSGGDVAPQVNSKSLSKEGLLQEAAKRTRSGLKEKPQHTAHVHTSIAGRTRFYKNVGVTPTDNGTFLVSLDGRALKTPARKPLELPTFELAMCIAAEWDAQTDVRKGLEPASMPLMTLVSTAIDQVQVDPHITINNCMGFLPTDAALFYTSEEDRILLSKQRQHLTPVVRWTQKVFGVELDTTSAIVARLRHSPESTSRIEGVLNKMDHFTLACLQCATMESKSLVLGLAFVCRYLSSDQIVATSRLEEEFQVEIWGVVEGGHDMDRLNNSVNLCSAGVLMQALLGPLSPKELVDRWS